MKHEKEIKRWGECKDGTAVWYKTEYTNWAKTTNPLWSIKTTYIVDDEWAKIAKQFIDDRDKVEFYDGHHWSRTLASDVHTVRKEFVRNYRIKTDEPTYYYQWEKLYPKRRIVTSEHLTDETADCDGYKVSEGWRRIDSSKRTWED